MKVLMLGWEFPPFISGGLGTACYGLTKALNDLGTQVTFVLPKALDTAFVSRVELPGQVAQPFDPYRREELPLVQFRPVEATLYPYSAPLDETADFAQPASVAYGRGWAGQRYTGDLFAEVDRYARLSVQASDNDDFDVIHAHDWMTYPAGMAISRITGKPLVVHVHSTELDRSGENPDPHIMEIEQRGMQAADAVIAVSFLTKNLLVQRYSVPPQKIFVVYNAVIFPGMSGDQKIPPIRSDERIVLFLGRITAQKGPEYFLAAARRVLEVERNVRFIMAGGGDQARRMIELATAMGLSQKVLFTGFLRDNEVERVFRSADLYVMPSVSEPFGIATLEALSYDVPVLISKQSGVSEVLNHVLKVDFWDIDEMANKIVAVLRHPPLQATLKSHGRFEIRKLDWKGAAHRCMEVYENVLSRRKQ